MNNPFLKAKHWQIFTLIFGLPLVIYTMGLVYIISSIATKQQPDEQFILGFVKYYPIFILIFIGLFYFWFGSMGFGVQKKIPDSLRMKPGLFKFFFFYHVLYVFSILAFMIYLFNGPIETFSPHPVAIALIVPFHFFAIFCIFYCLYFVSKSIKLAELKREVKFEDYAAEFFLLWFYPVGIWIVQPKINKIISEDNKD